MTATPQSDSRSPSRRALLAGALGGIGAWAAAAIGRASPVRGVNGEVIHVGDELTGSQVTRITNNANPNTVIWGDNHAGVGVAGTSDASYGVLGTSDTSFGVSGESSNSDGVRGLSTFGIGVHGTSTSGRGVFGHSDTTVGVFGDSNDAAGVRGAGAIGVEGTSNNKFAYGVGGSNTAYGGTGVHGQANGVGSRGVNAYSDQGHALHTDSPLGWAAYFDGRVFTKRHHDMGKVATPSSPGANTARIFVRDNGSGKLQLCVRFPTGAVQVLATQP
jgi:hypothetical protein